MNLLLDTHLLLWTVSMSDRLSARARQLIDDRGNDLHFSSASIWEIAIKSRRGRDDVSIDPHLLRRELVSRGFQELSVTSDHALGVTNLPRLHGDPFDHILLAQALAENLTLLTTDRQFAAYPGPILRV